MHQCLVNVVDHAGIGSAEVILTASDDEVSVMVLDSGRGFSIDDTGSDRLGLRQSVKRRVEAVDGSVRIWSTPGAGTSVIIRLPAERAAAG